MSQYTYVVVTTDPLVERLFESADELIEFLCDEKPDVFSVRKLWGVPSGKDRVSMREELLVQGGVVLGRIPF